MKRILVIGCIGSGKTTFAKKLSFITGISIFHLDNLFFLPNNSFVLPEEWNNIISNLIQKDYWIIDGNYPATLKIRYEKADTIFLIDIPRYRCILNVIYRYFGSIFRGTIKTDKPFFYKEKLTFNLFLRIINFNKTRKNRYYFDQIDQQKNNFFVFKNYKNINKYLKSLQK